jgi:hypothetical protein
MKNVIFYPWVGKNYSTTGFAGKKILVLGESCYCDDMHCKECGDLKKPEFIQCGRNFTKDVVKKFIDHKSGKGDSSVPSYTRFTNVLHGEQVSLETLTTFWNSVVFYNYSQKVLENSRRSPTKEDFAKSEPAFFEVLKKYKPDLIIVWGKRLWDRLPDCGKLATSRIMRGRDERFYFYEVDKKRISACWIYHPSSGRLKRTDNNRKYLQKAIELA